MVEKVKILRSFAKTKDWEDVYRKFHKHTTLFEVQREVKSKKVLIRLNTQKRH